MRLLCIGDVIGSVGCKFLRNTLPQFKKLKGVDYVICNAENSTDGNGVTPSSAEYLLSSSVDFLTLGNHSFRRKEIYNFLDEQQSIIRPYNYPSPLTPGEGFKQVDMGRTSIAIINLLGQEFMDANVDNPFYAADKALSKIDAKIIVVDFHAEATSEKIALSYYLDGRVSAVFGTHTHVQTADETVLKGGTGYITDVGMTGPIDSVIGVKKEIILEKFKTQMPQRFDYADGDCKLDCVIFDIDDKTGKTNKVERYSLS